MRLMRIPSELADEFSLELNKIHSNISDTALKLFKPVMQGRETKLMKLQHGPIEVEKLNVFYPEDIQKYWSELKGVLKDWQIDSAPTIAPLDGTESNPVKRFSTVFSTQLNNIKISCSFNIQYSSNKYYMLDQKIILLHKDLVQIDKEIMSVSADIEKRIWEEVKEDLKKRGIPVDDESYITQASRKEDYLLELISDFMDVNKKYELLFKEKESKTIELYKKKEDIERDLQKFVIETNVTQPVLLDALGISTRASGLFVYLDIRNASTDNDLSRDDISEAVTYKIMQRFKDVEDGLNKLILMHGPD